MTERAPIGDAADVRPLHHTLSQLRLGELLVEVQDRVEQIVTIESTPATGGTLLRWSAPLLQ